jgi:hypothetical protein
MRSCQARQRDHSSHRALFGLVFVLDVFSLAASRLSGQGRARSPWRRTLAAADAHAAALFMFRFSFPGVPGAMAVTLLEAPVGNDVVSVIHAGVLIPIEGAHQNEMIAPAVTE